MRKKFLRFVAAFCALGFLPATVQAQLEQPEQQDQAIQQPGEETQQPAPVGEQRQPIPDGDQKQPNERYEAQRIDPSASARQGEMSVQDYFVTKLMLANKAEIELSQMATEKSENQQVKQYAQKLVQDHQQMNEKLQQLGDRPQLTREDQKPRLSAGDQEGQKVPQQLTQVTQQAAEKHLQMVKETLQKKEGQDFDMGFLGMQIGAHMHMLAGLQAMQSVGSQEFQQLVKQAEQTTNEHLDQAKQLAQKLEDDRRAASRGSDPDAQPSRRGGVNDNRSSN